MAVAQGPAECINHEVNGDLWEKSGASRDVSTLSAYKEPESQENRRTNTEKSKTLLKTRRSRTGKKRLRSPRNILNIGKASSKC